MTCLVPWGANSLNLSAVLYRLTDDASAPSGNGPIAVAKLDQSTCPSALSWDGKTFGDTGNLTFDREAQTDLARRHAAVTMVELQAAGVKGPFSLHMGGADNAVSGGTSGAEQDKNRRIIILVP
jgi:hypothetical protein